MKTLKHFFLFSFRWQLKSFLVVNSFTVIMMILMGKMPHHVHVLGILSLYALFVYSVASVSFAMGSLGADQNYYGSSFSGKYLLSLPMSKKNLLFCLTVSNVYTLVPTLLATLWVSHLWKINNNPVTDDAFRDFVFFLSNHPVNAIAVLVLFYFSFLFYQIRQGIEGPRKMYNRGMADNYLLGFKGLITFAFYCAVVAVAFAFSVNKIFWPMLLVFLVMSIWESIKTYRVMTNESLSYWKWSRDLASIIIKLLFICLIFGGAFYLFTNSQYRYDKNSWAYFFSRGESIFDFATSGKVEEVQKYISANKPLNIVNSEGISLIHVFATLDFSKYKGIEEYFLKNPDLLMAKVHTKDKKCKTVFYCEGVTPFHILAAKGNSIILQKALTLKPEGISLLNSDDESPLHYSSRHCKYLTTKVLIDFKSDINKSSSELYSPLMEASSKGCYASCVLLLKAKASIELKNKDNKTASEIARTKKLEELAFLIDHFRD